MKTNSFRLGVALGLLLALFHAGWAALVALGWAQTLMDFVFWIHFITPPYRIQPFELGRAAILVSFVFVVGLVLGSIGGALWNRLTAAADK